jgi:uncharacterized protein with WD repeat
MAKQTFKEYLIEVMVDVDPNDPATSMGKVKQAVKNPDKFSKEQVASGINKQREIQQDKEDPLKSEKLRLAKMQQLAQSQEAKLAQKEKTAAKQAGMAPELTGRL